MGSEAVGRLRETYRSGLTRPLEWRVEQLRAMRRLLRDGEGELTAALRADLGKPALEAWMTELSFVSNEIDFMIRHLPAWARPERVRLPLVHRPGRARVEREPLGVALVIAPWNYPVHLLLLPMAAAISAGNCVVGKPSEVTPEISAAVARLVPRYLDQRAVAVVEGGVEQTQDLLGERFDHIFYTGNGRVGRVVMEAAARHLTPVTLELGGRSPTIVAADADIDVAARRIAWGKFVNAGQTCVAPDHVLVERGAEQPLLDALAGAVRRMYGADPRTSADYGRMVSDRHFERVEHLLRTSGGRVVVGGHTDRETRYVAPTVLAGVAPDAPVLQEEIFGPLLPVLPVDSVQEATEVVGAGPKPLALYVFTESEDTARQVLGATSSGGACVNQVLQHLGVPGLPFGGVGDSGSGAYHGRYGFETFSHRKAVMSKPSRPDVKLQYPPYSRLSERLIRRVLG